MHDVHFEIKAVGLGPFSFFNSCSIGFYMGKEIEILNLEVNGQKNKYNYDDYCLDINITLKNLQTAKVYLTISAPLGHTTFFISLRRLV